MLARRLPREDILLRVDEHVMEVGVDDDVTADWCDVITGVSPGEDGNFAAGPGWLMFLKIAPDSSPLEATPPIPRLLRPVCGWA